MHKQSACATFTYADEKLPAHGSLCKAQLSAAMKRLRYYVAKRGGGRFSFDACGEYSPDVMRPHYHVALFGWWPPDARYSHKSRAGGDEYRSAELERVWPFGRVTFQAWNFSAASYCAGHQAWKLTGDVERERLLVRDGSGVVIGEREPEFHNTSRRPGIGRRFVERYGEQALTLDHTVIDGRKVPVPGYYARIGAELFPEVTEAHVARRLERAKALEAERTPVRREAIEECAQAKILRSKGFG